MAKETKAKETSEHGPCTNFLRNQSIAARHTSAIVVHLCERCITQKQHVLGERRSTDDQRSEETKRHECAKHSLAVTS
jgi:hypothetical protein